MLLTGTCRSTSISTSSKRTRAGNPSLFLIRRANLFTRLNPHRITQASTNSALAFSSPAKPISCADANHPAYQLRTYSYPIPPYTDPHQAVRTGMDFLINMGDTWLSNTPRRGSVALRTTMTHSETELCIACHPSQFTTRGELTAIRNGYPPVQREALEFITDRLYNNARPLYGEPGTNWVRVIYSARAVASRLPLLTH